MPGTIGEREQNRRWSQGDRDIRMRGSCLCEGPRVEAHRTLDRAGCSTVGRWGAGVGGTSGAGRPGQSPGGHSSGASPSLASVLHSLALPGGPLG